MSEVLITIRWMTTQSDENADQSPNQPPEARPITPTMDVHQRPDQNLWEIASVSDFFGFPLTLYLPWGIVSGHTAAPNDYYKHLAESVRNMQLPPDLDPGWKQVISDFAARAFDQYANVKPSERAEKVFYDGVNLTAAINIKDAKCWVGGYPRPIEHEYLRVRLTDVTAWAWGAIT